MKAVKGVLSDEERRIIIESNRTGRRILVAAMHACVVYDQRRATPYCEEPMQAVGAVKGWGHDSFQVGGWSFLTSIPWPSAVRVWWRDAAPDEGVVAALLAEHKRPDGAPPEMSCG